MSRLRGTVLEIDMNAVSISLALRLSNKPLKFLRAYTADEGIKLAETEQPDVIFLNPFMPVVNGFEVYEILQSNQNTKHIPVIFYPPPIPEVEKEVKKSGVPYILRPIRFDELFEYLATYLTVVED